MLSRLDGSTRVSDIADLDTTCRDDLVSRLAQRFPHAVAAAGLNPAGFDLVVNATPVGMRAGDASPIDTAGLTSRMTVADVTTPPGESALIAASRTVGCRTIDGRTMFDAGVGLLTDYMVGPE